MSKKQKISKNKLLNLFLQDNIEKELDTKQRHSLHNIVYYKAYNHYHFYDEMINLPFFNKKKSSFYYIPFDSSYILSFSNKEILQRNKLYYKFHIAFENNNDDIDDLKVPMKLVEIKNEKKIYEITHYQFIILQRKNNILYTLNVEYNEPEIIYSDILTQFIDFCKFNGIYFNKRDFKKSNYVIHTNKHNVKILYVIINCKKNVFKTKLLFIKDNELSKQLNKMTSLEILFLNPEEKVQYSDKKLMFGNNISEDLLVFDTEYIESIKEITFDFIKSNYEFFFLMLIIIHELDNKQIYIPNIKIENFKIKKLDKKKTFQFYIHNKLFLIEDIEEIPIFDLTEETELITYEANKKNDFLHLFDNRLLNDIFIMCENNLLHTIFILFTSLIDFNKKKEITYKTVIGIKEFDVLLEKTDSNITNIYILINIEFSNDINELYDLKYHTISLQNNNTIIKKRIFTKDELEKLYVYENNIYQTTHTTFKYY